jgi:hypothetical protein
MCVVVYAVLSWHKQLVRCVHVHGVVVLRCV